ncbi:MAG: hypothetical protein AAF632_00465 [Bacteroidota bacterium]
MMNCYRFAIFLYFGMIPLANSAQVNVQQGGIHISGSDPLITVNTSFINYGTIIQQGTLITDSDLLNYGSYEGTEMSLVLQGRDQRILTDSLVLARLRITGGGIKTLEGNLEVTKNLHLRRGLLRVDDLYRFSLNEDATVTQNNENSYIWGSMSHRGTGNKFFPVGTQDAYAPLTLTNIQGNNPLVRVKYVPVDDQPFWSQTQLAGSYQGSPITVTFPTQNPDYEAYPEQLAITAGTSQEQTETTLTSELQEVALPRITLASTSSTVLPWISVGFSSEGEEIYVPNAFSPEAPDPEDRSIKVYGKYLSDDDFYFGIQDTWGRWVYQTTSLENAMGSGWTSSQVNSDPTQFRYVVSGYFLSGTPFQLSDTIVKF